MSDTSEPAPQKQHLIKDKLFTIPAAPDEKPQLLGSSCKSCGETVFPMKKRCPNCASEDIIEVPIGPFGKLYSFTVLYQLPPVGYKGPVPYGVAKVEMAEGTRVTGYCTENDPSKLRPGMDMELIIDRLFTDDENCEVIGFKFKPLSNGDR
jgi:uncharacterized OB-fold protein